MKMEENFRNLIEKECLNQNMNPEEILGSITVAKGEEEIQYPFVIMVLGILDTEKRYLIPESISRCDSLCMAGFEVLKMAYGSEKRTCGGRISINDVPSIEQDFLFAEGNIEAFQILMDINKMAQGIFKNQIIPGMDRNMIPAFNVKLGMDDMNIRGKQIVYANEFCDGDIAKLCRYFQRRNRKMIQYINKKTAEDFEKSQEELTFDFERRFRIAVDAGASSTEATPYPNDYIMTGANYEDFLSVDVEKEVIDYASMDIVSGTGRETALKIAQAHGFELQSRIKIMSKYEKDFDWILMLNPKSGDILEAGAIEQDFCYGGCTVFAARNTFVKRSFMPMEDGVKGNIQQFDNESDWTIYECSYRDGVFRQLEHLPENQMEDIDMKNYPIRGVLHLPVPRFLSEEVLFESNNFRYMDSHFVYLMENIINALLLKQRWDEVVTKNLEPFYKRWENDYFETLFKHVYIDLNDCCVIEKAFQFALEFTGMSPEEVRKPLIKYLTNEIKRHRMLSKENQKKAIERIKKISLVPSQDVIKEVKKSKELMQY